MESLTPYVKQLIAESPMPLQSLEDSFAVDSSGFSTTSYYYKTLVDQTVKGGFIMQEVSADKGYISMKNLQATVDVGAVPFIAFKSNARADRGTDVWSRCSSITTTSAKNS